jgi:hypothetical protein
MKLNSTTMLAAFVLIGAGAFMAGRVSSPSNSPTVAWDGPAETRSSRAADRESNGDHASSRKNSRSLKSERGESGSSKDRLAKLEAIVRGENPLERNRALLAYLDQLGPGDFEAAVAHFRSLGITDSRNGEYSLLLTAWAQADPVAALSYADENTSGEFAKDTILTSWASTDPEAAIRWAQANHEGDEPNPYLPGIIRGLSESDPARATELLATMPRSEERARGLDFILPHLLQKGADATRAWIASLPDDSLKNGAMTRAAAQLADSDPAGTASWLLANPGEAAQRRIDDVYSAWAQKDQQAALSSYSTLPSGENRSNALRGVISSIASESPQAAVSLMDRYPEDVNDRVIQNFVWHALGSDPATAIAAIPRIGDERRRDQMFRRTLEMWKERDPDAANAWLLKNPGTSAVVTPR